MTVINHPASMPPVYRPLETLIPVHYGDDLKLAVTTDPASDLWKEAAEVEASVFIEKDYIKSADELAREYAPYLAQTTMLSLLKAGEVIGASRVIDYSPTNGFKTTHDLEEGRLLLDEQGEQIMPTVDLACTMEIGTIALKEEYRGASGARAGVKYIGVLYGGQYQRAVNKGDISIIASFDAKYFKGFGRRFSEFTTPVGPAVHYMGSPTVPAVLDVTKMSLDRFIDPTPRTAQVEAPAVVAAPIQAA